MSAQEFALPGDRLPDEELMRGVQERNPEALGELYHRGAGLLKALMLRIVHDEAEAEDLVQEVFTEIWKQAKNYSSDKGQALSWMVTLARRRAIDRLRTREAYVRAEERFKHESDAQAESWFHNRTDEEIALWDTRQLLDEVMLHLPAPQREAIEMAYYQGMSQREIAAQTDIPLGTIKTRLHLGLRKIYEELKGFRDEL